MPSLGAETDDIPSVTSQLQGTQTSESVAGGWGGVAWAGVKTGGSVFGCVLFRFLKF